MTLLTRVLKLQAAVWLLAGSALVIAPGTVLRLLDDPAGYAWLLRATGVMALAIALLMILVAQRTEVWWWAWVFALLEAATATTFVVRAVTGGAGGEWAWWSMGGLAAAFAVLDLIGLALAGQEKPFV